MAGAGFYGSATVLRPPEDRTYKNAEDWADLFNEAGIYKSELEGGNAFAEMRVGRMTGPTIVQAVGHAPSRQEGHAVRYEVYPLLLLPPGYDWPLTVDHPADPVAAELKRRFYLD
jgi:hypothetical protein